MIFSFIFVYAVTFLLAILLIVFCTKKNYLTKPTLKRMSQSNQLKANWIIRSFIAILAILNMIFFVVPLSVDIPNLISGNYAISKGIITSYEHNKNNNAGNPGNNFFDVQKITLDNYEKFRVYYGPIVEKGEKIDLKYLPYSKFVVDIDIIK